MISSYSNARSRPREMPGKSRLKATPILERQQRGARRKWGFPPGDRRNPDFRGNRHQRNPDFVRQLSPRERWTSLLSLVGVTDEVWIEEDITESEEQVDEDLDIRCNGTPLYVGGLWVLLGSPGPGLTLVCPEAGRTRGGPDPARTPGRAWSHPGRIAVGPSQDPVTPRLQAIIESSKFL